MNNTIIECREAVSYNKLNPDPASGAQNVVNGSFSVELDKNLILEDGDEINIKSAFIDTTQSIDAGKIKIDSTNKNISISNYLYLNNFRTTAQGDRGVSYDTTLPAGDKIQPDGRLYVLCENKNNIPIPAPFQSLKKITQIRYNLRSGRFGADFGGFSVTYQYQDYDNKTQTRTLKFPKISSMDTNQEFGIVPLGGDILFLSRGDTESDLNQDFREIGGKDHNERRKAPYNVESVNISSAPAGVGNQFFPKQFTTTFTLDEGVYTPDLLAKLLTDKITNINSPDQNLTPEQILDQRLPSVAIPVKYQSGDHPPASIVFPTRSKFLTSTKQLLYDNAFYEMNTPDNLVFVANDGRSIMTFEGKTDDLNYLVGSSQISIEFNSLSNKFVFSQLHTSHFNDSQIPIVQYIAQDNGGNITSANLSDSIGGVILADLSPPELWHDSMGFDNSIILTPDAPVQIAELRGTSDFNDVLLPKFTSIQRGVNITSDITGLDASVQKQNFVASDNAGDRKGADIVPSVEEIISVEKQGTAVMNVLEIPAQTDFGEVQAKEGYFLIRVQGIPPQNLINMPSQEIQAIVSKYYSAGQFLIMEGGAGSLMYRHVGEPFYIQQLKIQILEADGSLPVNIGNNSTVFLEVIKNNNKLNY